MGNLRDRLRLIKNTLPLRHETVKAEGDFVSTDKKQSPSATKNRTLPGSDWISIGFLGAKRSVYLNLPIRIPASFPRTLRILVPDSLAYLSSNGSIEPEDPVFFDLETTGLSGGAGTVAFLAAFGRFVRTGTETQPYRLKIDQYLLLDYPGEADFLEALLPELALSSSSGTKGGKPPLVISYNGKRFDAQILKTRCLMNGIPLPVYNHADLLYPARRLWKGLLPDCSQRTVETSVLGLDRTGALAPELWFSFLKSGEPKGLLGICEHNQRDILGLASLFSLLAHIAACPLQAIETYPYNLGNLALRWRETLRREAALGEKEAHETGKALLEAAATPAYPRATLALGLDLIGQGRHEAGRRRLQDLIKGNYPAEIKIPAFKALAIDAEWRLRDRDTALGYVEEALHLGEIQAAMKDDFLHRRERLLKK